MDSELRLQLLRASVRDIAFLKLAGRELEASDFSERSEGIIAKAALDFWRDYFEPIGPLLRSHVSQHLARLKLGSDARNKLEANTKDLIDSIMSPDFRPVSVRALHDRVKALRSEGFYDEALERILEAREKGVLDSTLLVDIVDDANKKLSDAAFRAVDILDDEEMLRRQKRRNYQEEHIKYPSSGIWELDKKIRLIPKGHVALFLAPYSSGKGFALCWMGYNYAMQGLNVWHITLEDPEEEVEDRYDSLLSYLPKSRLKKLPNKLKRKFRESVQKIRGRIRLTDWTEEDVTLNKIERGYELLKMEGFEPDVIIVDYDDEMKVEKKFSGESARRMEFAELYRGQRKLAKRLNVIYWTAAQTGRAGEGRKIITGKDVAEDISKIRKVTLAIGIGTDSDNPAVKHLYVIRHRLDRSRFGVDIVSDLSRSHFYHQNLTVAHYKAKPPKPKRKKADEVEATKDATEPKKKRKTIEEMEAE